MSFLSSVKVTLKTIQKPNLLYIFHAGRVHYATVKSLWSLSFIEDFSYKLKLTYGTALWFWQTKLLTCSFSSGLVNKKGATDGDEWRLLAAERDLDPKIWHRSTFVTFDLNCCTFRDMLVCQPRLATGLKLSCIVQSMRLTALQVLFLSVKSF